MFDEQPTQALARKTPKEIITARLPKMLSAMPAHMHERFRQAAISVAMQPAVADCTPESVASAVYACARLNVYPDPVLKQAYIIPFKGKAQLILGYPGLIELARRACPGLQLHTGVVYENDEHRIIQGTRNEVVITKAHWQKDENPGELIFAYCAYKTPEASDYETVIVPRYKLEELKGQKVRPGSQSPWVTNFAEMSEKTAIRRAARFWTLSAEHTAHSARFREALAVDESDELPAAPGEDNPDLAEMGEGDAPIVSRTDGTENPRKVVKSTTV